MDYGDTETPLAGAGYILLSAAEMRAAEAEAVARGASSLDLMRRAGEGVAAQILWRWTKRRVAVMCGPGANGGDGFVAAKALADFGWSVRLFAMRERGEYRGDTFAAAHLWDGPIETYTDVLRDAELIVDALFGTGLSRALEGEAAEIVAALNAAARANEAPVVAVDLPSGVDADTGAVRGACVAADVTVTFAARKPGHLLYPGRAQAGAVDIVDIGVTPEMMRARTFENDPVLWKAAFSAPGWDAHKYSRGHAAVVSGPRLKTGAARLAARAALRVGAGLVTLLSPKSAADENAAQVTAIMIREADGASDVTAVLGDRRFTAALIGPGAGVGEETAQGALAILRSTARAVLDADALTCFASEPTRLFAQLRADDVLTPHGGEFAKVFPDLDPSVIGKLAAARDAATRAGCIVLLKGADTVIAAPDGRAVLNANAPPALATAGSGDVLAGIIVGLLAQGLAGFDAACAGAYLHGAAGAALGHGLIAEDLERALPGVFLNL